MAKLSDRAISNNLAQLAKDYENTTRENAESQSFWNDFLAAFGIDRKVAGFFEYFVEMDRVDLFIPGKLIVEQKSRDNTGKNSLKAKNQILRYLNKMTVSKQVGEKDFPAYSLISDFHDFELRNIQTNQIYNFKLPDLPNNGHLFGFLTDVAATNRGPLKPADRSTLKAMNELQRCLEERNYPLDHLHTLMTRFAYCMYAEHSNIFNWGAFTDLLESSSLDGRDLGTLVNSMFRALSEDYEKRETGIAPNIDAFPYINGGMFKGTTPSFTGDAEIRKHLLDASSADWKDVTLAAFGSLFQNVIAPIEQRKLGAYFTSEANIKRVLAPILFDRLYDELQSIKALRVGRIEAAKAFRIKLARTHFFDPACGCGNFLVVAYTIMRTLEIEALEIIHGTKVDKSMVAALSWIDIDKYHGIEIMPHAVSVAQLSLRIADDRMNQQLSKKFGVEFKRIPLNTEASIATGNALAMDWRKVFDPTKSVFVDGAMHDPIVHVIGNPPYSGARKQMTDNRASMLETRTKVFPILGTPIPNAKKQVNADFASAWLWMSAAYLGTNDGSISFIMTNSITQGEQVAVVWPALKDAGFEIVSAHRSFEWKTKVDKLDANAPRANKQANVIVVAVSLMHRDRAPSDRLLHRKDKRGIWSTEKTSWITPYLTDGSDWENRWAMIEGRKHPQRKDLPKMQTGIQPNDGGKLILETKEEYDEVVAAFPKGTSQQDIDSIVRPFVGAKEFLHGIERHIIFLADKAPDAFLDNPVIDRRLGEVTETREQSSREGTQKIAKSPRRFTHGKQMADDLIVVPLTTSSARKYIPMVHYKGEENGPKLVLSNLIGYIEGGEDWLLALLMSSAHRDWIDLSCGQMKEDTRYSNTLGYNTFPWPDGMDRPGAKERLTTLVGAVIDARNPNLTLAQSYIDKTMDLDLEDAHDALDKFVDGLYGNGFGPHNRIQRLVAMYERNLIAEKTNGTVLKSKASKKKAASKPRNVDDSPGLFDF